MGQSELCYENMVNNCKFLVAGHRYIKVAKSPMSPPLAFPFEVTSSGIILLDDDGVEMKGAHINSIDHQGLLYLSKLSLQVIPKFH